MKTKKQKDRERQRHQVGAETLSVAEYRASGAWAGSHTAPTATLWCCSRPARQRKSFAEI
ncbi:hypothetical protein [Acuticoccus sediminis]|uniref:hypothetical protein n=1 Tax=Acuticoccus sediminis TaxID=2184697 RepID=UPI0011B939F7|nr:hypothetical protein [Acuticoccus sediminis]